MAALDSVEASAAYDTLPIADNSSIGGMNLRINGSTYAPVTVMDLAAPGTWSYMYRPNINSYDPMYVGPGTSFAAPTGAAGVAMLRDAFVERGWSWAGPRDLMAAMLLMGDGFHEIAGGYRAVGLDRGSGAGRMKMHYPSSQDLVAPWNWGIREFQMLPGQVVVFPLADYGPKPASVTQLKVAMTFKEADYTNAADIDLKIYSNCGGTPEWLAQDTLRDIHSRVVLSQSSITGKCTEAHVEAYYIPPGQSRTVNVSYYYHSGSTVDH